MFLLSPGHTGTGPHGMGIPMINANTATAAITDAKDIESELVVTLTDGTVVIGDPISVNSKGVNLRIDGRTKSISLSKIESLTHDGVDDDSDDDTDRLEELANEVSDGATTAEVAALLSDYLDRDLTPKELRVHLRALGLGVGKGRKYALSTGEFRAVVNVINATPVVTA